MSRAYSMIRPGPEYRSEAFIEGLKAAGYAVTIAYPGGAIAPDDVVIIWNRYGVFDQIAQKFEAAGAAVIVAENGYLGADQTGNQFYALSLKGHNGSGRTPIGSLERFERLGIALKPWRTEGRHILVRSQRGIGVPGQASPQNWHNNAVARLSRLTPRPLEILPHPKLRQGGPVRLKDKFRDCWAVVTWASAIAGRALVAGLPVFIDAPHSIVEAACNRFPTSSQEIEFPKCDDGARLAALARLAWGQWSLAELRSGEPFLRLKDLHRA